MRRRQPSAASVDRRLRTTDAIARDELPPDLVARLRRGGPATSVVGTAIGGRAVEAPATRPAVALT